MNRTYHSNVDPWLVGVVLAVFAALAWCVVSEFSEGRTDSAWVMLAVSVGMAALIPLFGLPCKYTLCEDHILVQSGLVKRRFLYGGIKKIELSSNMISSPALSIKRIRIDMNDKRFVLISPKDREEFISLVKERMKAAKTN